MLRDDALVRQNRNIVVLLSFLSGVAIIAALYLARDILLPFALSILLSFLLSPLVELLEKFRVGRITSVLIVVASSFCGIGLLSFVLLQQIYDLAHKLPEYKTNIINKADAFQTRQDGVVEKVLETIQSVREGLARKARTPEQPAAERPKSKQTAGRDETKEPAASVDPPIPVEIIDKLTAQEVATNIVGPVVGPLGTAAMVLIFLIFMLIEREDLRNRLIHLIGPGQLNLTTQALDDAASRVSRYLLMQLIINTVYGIVIAIGLALIGLPNALLWGALTAVLRFVPYVGPWIAAVIPIAVSLAVFDGWTKPLLIFALFMGNELISNNIMEPWLYGSSTGISTIGILVSAVFWTWLWGPIGLVMATPLTVCLTVVGRYVPQLAFLNTLLTDQQVLLPETRFYQRLLAEDPEESIDIAEEYLTEGKTLEELYEEVLLPALCLAQQDHRRGELDDSKMHFVNQTVRELVEDLGEKAAVKKSAEAASVKSPDTLPEEKMLVLCLPARDETDQVAGTMLVQLLEARGCSARVLSPTALAGEMLEQVTDFAADGVCVSAVPPFASSTARYLAKRLRQTFPKLRIVAGLWQKDSLASRAEERLAASGIDRMEHTLVAAADELIRLIQSDKMLDPATVPPSAAAAK